MLHLLSYAADASHHSGEHICLNLLQGDLEVVQELLACCPQLGCLIFKYLQRFENKTLLSKSDMAEPFLPSTTRRWLTNRIGEPVVKQAARL